MSADLENKGFARVAFHMGQTGRFWGGEGGLAGLGEIVPCRLWDSQ